MKMKSSDRHTDSVLVMSFVVRVQEGLVHKCMEGEEKKILDKHHQYYLGDYMSN